MPRLCHAGKLERFVQTEPGTEGHSGGWEASTGLEGGAGAFLTHSSLEPLLLCQPGSDPGATGPPPLHWACPVACRLGLTQADLPHWGAHLQGDVQEPPAPRRVLQRFSAPTLGSGCQAQVLLGVTCWVVPASCRCLPGQGPASRVQLPSCHEDAVLCREPPALALAALQSWVSELTLF